MNIKGKLIRIFLVVFSLIFSIIFLGTLFDNKSILGNVNPLIVIPCFILFFLFFIFIFHLIEKHKNIDLKKEKRIFFILFLVILILQCLSAYYLISYPAWDWNDVYHSAIAYVKGAYNEVDWAYFSEFPNNYGLLYFEILIFKIAKFFHLLEYSLVITVIGNVVLIDISIILLYLTVRNIYDNKKALFSLTLVMFSTAFYCYIPILYTDTVTMFIPIALLYIYSLFLKSNKKNRFIFILIFTLLSIVGSYLKFTTIIVVIGIIIHVFLNYDLKKSYKYLLFFMVSFFCLYGDVKYIEVKKSIFPYDINRNEHQIPYTHWIMMGMTERNSYSDGKKFIGWYNPESYEYTRSYDNTDSMRNANVVRIKETLKDYGAGNYIKFLYRKALFTWSDGTYYAPAFLRENPVNKTENIFSNFFHSNGKYFNISFVENTCIILLFYAMLIVGAGFYSRDKYNLSFVSYISLFGVLIFFCIWEASSRYLINYVPLIILGCIAGFDRTYCAIQKFMKRKRSKR